MPPKVPLSLDGGVSKNARKGTKSRTGCQTCKVKRLKCDESKPACHNCVKRGLACPGYKQVLRWSTKYEAAPPPESSSQVTVHPSVEYHFSAIDPSSFGEAAPEKFDPRSALDGPRTEPVPENFVSEPNSTSIECNERVTPASSPCAVPVPDDELSAHFPIDLSQLIDPDRIGLVRRNEDGNRNGVVQQFKPRSRMNPEPSAQWKSLLRSYYRMSEPALPRSLHMEASTLVEHYFRDVCVIFSAFDSEMNPFRTVIARLWDNSSSIFFAIQSMAAAHLANYMPNMRLTGLNMQRKAYECLQQELQLASINQTMDDKLLLAVLLLGLSACWHDSSDLGEAHLSAARALIRPRLLREDNLPGTDANRNDQFFAEALIYWEMCMAFVSQETFIPGMERRLPVAAMEGQQTPREGKVFPHPWTGIAPRVQMLFAEVGRLVRHYCMTRNTFFDFNAPPLVDMDTIVAAAQDLEEELLSICLPSVDDLVDVQDERTHKSDFISIAEATKCAALLEIYRVFPGILASRLGSTQSGGSGSATSFFSFETLTSQPGRLDDSNVDGTRSWLTSLAIHILNLLAKVPTSSGTRPLQLIVLVVSASEVHLGSPAAPLSPGLSESTSYDVEVARARGFAMARLNQLASRLPSKPVLRMIQLVREVWRRNDGGECVFWMDVMTLNGWETIMG